ncbi:D-2-hydroxyacid dehydrogenase [Rheinheimera baltica]|uniref:D-2-hydroxyacid dehydrogenase n=1 Tax=Rheinheimera baltica TaxID=67576 RepID=A0ABT9I1B2_9GAMM|nr:D-2-hydroxyacid dehydrogenase [Rheinheimera baltica]MDP5137180.1 D-2-hydroxyacid dehydrogenase [Rheinheimera baltica]
MHSMVFLDAASMGDTDLSALSNTAIPLTCYDHTTEQQVVPRLAQASIAIVNKVQLTADMLLQLPQLKLICVAATGVNNVDLVAAQQQGVVVCNVRGYADTAVAQHVFALLLQLSNKVQQYHHAVRVGHWSQSRHFCLLDYPITELAGKTFVVIGYGALGQASSKLALAFGMQVIIAEQQNAPYCREGRVPFAAALAQADVISLHCPLTPLTERLFNQQTFAAINPGALLINTARGGLIDELALLDALQHGTLGGAALDVLTQEPPLADNLLIQANLPNLLLTPHVAWASAEARLRMVQQLADNITAYTEGNTQNQIWPTG